MTDAKAICQLCGEPMPKGEEMFNYHGYSGPCPKPPKPKEPTDAKSLAERIKALCKTRNNPPDWAELETLCNAYLASEAARKKAKAKLAELTELFAEQAKRTKATAKDAERQFERAEKAEGEAARLRKLAIEVINAEKRLSKSESDIVERHDLRGELEHERQRQRDDIRDAVFELNEALAASPTTAAVGEVTKLATDFLAAYNASRNTAIVDDDFREMLERSDLAAHRLQRALNAARGGTSS